MRAEVKALHQQLKTTSVYVTHDQVEAMTMADRIVVMHDGVVQQVGPPLELYDHPANLFVAGFIGSPGMNFLPATFSREGGAHAVLADGQKLRLVDRLPLKDGESITIGLRPEHIKLSDKDDLKAEVEVVEPLGLSTQFYAKMAGLDLCVFAMGRPTVKPGDRISLSADAMALHVFHAVTGVRITA
jgi:multiple sugar transport system ATP-binding protein